MNLERFGLIKNDQGAIEPEGSGELVEVPEHEALNSSAEIYKYESVQELLDRARTLAANLPTSLTTQFYSRAFHHAQSARPIDAGMMVQPIPPRRRRKYVKHEKKTSKAYVEKTKKKRGILDFDNPLVTIEDEVVSFHLTADEALELFPKKNNPDKLDKNLFARNVVWQLYQLTLRGKPPEFMAKGCNMRTIFYLMKPTLTANKIFTDDAEKTKKQKAKDEGDIDSFYGNFTKAVQTLVLDGLISYRDLYIEDDRKPFRFLPPARFNTHILLLAEKKAYLGRFLAYASKYGVMAQITKGLSTYLMTDTLLTEMFELGYDFSKDLTILSFCDFDPVGSSIPHHFAKHLKELGFHNITQFEQYGSETFHLDTKKRKNGRKVYEKVVQRRPCLDIVNPHELDPETKEQIRHALKPDQRDDYSTTKWARITGGVTGTGRNTKYAISAEQFLPYINEQLEKKIAPLLAVPSEEVGLSSSLKALTRALQRHIGIRALKQAQEANSQSR
ncbi:MAG: hypothetical protein KC800_00590 [Candidatus Eremiobacteraeota bacterium]|nr:hypothetical protein [Candidatus Eremiobacteraeota bacterium]